MEVSPKDLTRLREILTEAAVILDQIEDQKPFKLEESKPATKKRTGSMASGRPSMEDVVEFCLATEMTKEDGEYAYHKWVGNGWKNGGATIKNWQSTLIAWRTAGYLPSRKNGAPAPARGGASGKPPKWDEFMAQYPNPGIREKLSKWEASAAPQFSWLRAEFDKWRKGK